MEVIVSSKGQMTLPVAIREQFHITTGTRVSVQAGLNGAIMLVPKTKTLNDVFGLLKRPEGVQPLQLDEIDTVIAEAVAADDQRIMTEWKASKI